MTEPTTDAGRVLLNAMRIMYPDERAEEWHKEILAIEREAAARAAEHRHEWKREYAPNYRQASETDDWREECACGAWRTSGDAARAAGIDAVLLDYVLDHCGISKEKRDLIAAEYARLIAEKERP